MEIRSGNRHYADSLLARAIQDCPHSGILRAEAIFMETESKRKTKCVDAMKYCEDDPVVLLALARFFWSKLSIDKARDWFDKCIRLNSDFGDAYAHMLKFEIIHGDEQSQARVKEACVKAEPRHGIEWCTVSKDVKNWKKKCPELLEIVADKVVVPV
ncbi:hypothetical protein ACOME3_005609 [Neoechinorhynchus agilis]